MASWSLNNDEIKTFLSAYIDVVKYWYIGILLLKYAPRDTTNIGVLTDFNVIFFKMGMDQIRTFRSP